MFGPSFLAGARVSSWGETGTVLRERLTVPGRPECGITVDVLMDETPRRPAHVLGVSRVGLRLLDEPART